MDKKVHAIPVAIDIAEYLHQPGFHPAHIHPADHMENANRTFRFFSHSG
jgi:hypothetical protein